MKTFKSCVGKKFTIYEVFLKGGNIRQINNATIVDVDTMKNSARLITPLLYSKCAPCYLPVDLNKGEVIDSNASRIFLNKEKAKDYSISLKLIEIKNIINEINNIKDNLIDVV